MPARLCAFVIWALVAASAVFWGLRLLVGARSAPPHTVAAADTASMRADLTRLLGAPRTAAVEQPQAPALASRFQLTGVMAPKPPSHSGIALIAVDGKMPRAFRVGSPIDGELVLKSVSLRTAEIGTSSGGSAVVLQMPPLPVVATGTLPPVDPMRPPSPAATPRPAPALSPAQPPAYAPSAPNSRVVPPHSRGLSMSQRQPVGRSAAR